MNPTNGNGLTLEQGQPVKTLSKRTADFIPRAAFFPGTDNPRELRVIQALLVRPRRREDIDAIAGAANGPDLISNLRNLFPKTDDRNEYISCERISFVDRDGKVCKPGVYSLGEQARKLINSWMARRKVDKHA